MKMPAMKTKNGNGNEKRDIDSDKENNRLRFDSSKLFEYKFMIEGLFRRFGPTKSKITIKSRENQKYPLKAGINPDSWDVHYSIRKGLEFRDDQTLLKYLDRHNIVDPVKELIRDVSYHEMGHWEFPRGTKFGCPYDKPAYYVSFIEPIYEVVAGSGKYKEKFSKQLSAKLANAVSDVIDNYNVHESLKEFGERYNGQILFWHLQGQVGNGKYSREYTMFVDLNLLLFGAKEDRELLEKFMIEDGDIKKSVKRLANLFTPDAVYDRKKWEMLAREYAAEAIKFIDEGEKSDYQYSSGDTIPFPEGGGEKDEEEPGEEGAGGSGQERGEPGEEEEGEGSGGLGGDEKEEGGEEEEEGAGASFEPGEDLSQEDKEAIMGGREGGKGIPFYLKTSEALDAYYRALAKKIPIKMRGALPTADFPVIPLTRERFDPDVHSIEDAVTSKIYLDPVTRTLTPSVVKTKLSVDVPLIKEKKDLPDYIFTLIDSSGSMMCGGDRTIVPWGNESFYHYSLITFYGILRFFELERILHKIDVSAAIFSDVTIGSKGLKETKELLFNPATGGTNIDVSKVLELLKDRRGAFFSMITDGFISNWDSVRDEFIEVARRNQFFMIQIGPKSPTCTDLEKAGLPVYYVSRHEDIVRLAIDLTVKRYRALISGKLEDEAKKYSVLSYKKENI